MTGRARSANGLLNTLVEMPNDEWIDEKLLDEVESILGGLGMARARAAFASARRRLRELEALAGEVNLA